VKILLVNPTYYSFEGLASSYGEPLGLAYIAAAIEEDGKHEVEIVDSVGLSTEFEKIGEKTRMGLPDDKLLDLIAQKSFDVVGISLIPTMYADQILTFIGQLKKRFPDKTIIVGGAHATLEWKACLESGLVDFVVLGEGEETIVELLDTLSGKKDIKKVYGLVYKDKNGGFCKTPERKPLDIEKIPWPALHLLPMENYFRLRPDYFYIRSPAVSILTSRACPYNCVFCSTKLFWGRKWRGRSAKSVVNEIEYRIEKYGAREFLIQDDNFLANPIRAEVICDEIIKRKLNIKWRIPPGVGVWLLSERLLKKMRDSGLYMLRPQTESGSFKTLEYINKPINLDQVKKIVKCANRLGIWVQTNIIIGFYFETKEDIQQSIRFAESVGFDSVEYVIAIPYSHTKMHEDYLRNGLITKDVPLKPAYDIKHFSADEIVKIRNEAQQRYKFVRLRQILKPYVFFTEFFPKINSWEKFSFFFKRVKSEFI